MSFQNINRESGGAGGGGGGGGKVGSGTGGCLECARLQRQEPETLKGCLLLMHTLRDYVFTQQRRATA